jgi:hypothetical protein
VGPHDDQSACTSCDDRVVKPTRPSGAAAVAAFTRADPVKAFGMIPLLVLIGGAVVGLSGVVLLNGRDLRLRSLEVL